MELSPHLAALRTDLAAAAAIGGADVTLAAELLGDALEPALRLVLLDVLADAAAELEGQLPGAAVEVRLRGREPQLVAQVGPAPAAAPPVDSDDSSARLTLRLPEVLKTRAEAAAAAEGLSTNSWLVRAVQSALDPRPSFPFPGSPAGGTRRLQGYGRA